MGPILTTLIIIGIIFAAVAVGVMIIKHKLNMTAKKYLGMNLSQTSNMIKKGLREETQKQKPIASLTAVYKPKLLRDFPETSYEQIEQMARNALTGFLTAVTARDTAKLYAPSRNLTQQAQDRIDASTPEMPEKFEKVKIHKTSFTDYKSADGVADATFQIAFEALHGGTEPEQLACSVVLNSGRAEADDDNGRAVYSMTCPNCGAPLRVAGKDTFCRFCGTGVSENGTKVWLADSVKFI